MGLTKSGGLISLCKRVAEWRRVQGGRGGRLPDALWIEAARVAEVAGVHATARAARLNYARLRARCDARGVGAGAGDEKVIAARGHEGARGAETGGFVALEVGGLALRKQTTLELVRPSGERLRVEVGGEVDLAGVVAAFLRVAS